jgi:hypothetical protein
MWVAPNVLTFTGFMFLVLQFLLFSYYDHYFYASDDSHPEYRVVPNFMWLVAALCMFWAHQLGKNFVTSLFLEDIKETLLLNTRNYLYWCHDYFKAIQNHL